MFASFTKKEKKMITLVKKGRRILIKSAFNKELNSVTKDVKGYIFDMDTKEWHLPIDKLEEYCKKLDAKGFKYTIQEDPSIEYYEHAPHLVLKFRRVIDSKKYLQIVDVANGTYDRLTRTLTYQLSEKNRVLKKLKELDIAYINAADIDTDNKPNRAWPVREPYAKIFKTGKNKLFQCKTLQNKTMRGLFLKAITCASSFKAFKNCTRLSRTSI